MVDHSHKLEIMRNTNSPNRPILVSTLILICFEFFGPSGAVEPGDKINSVIMAEKYDTGDWPADETTILDAEMVERNLLKLTVYYCAGSRDHKFQLIALPGLLESYPPQKMIVLSHDANRDTCIVQETKVLYFDLRPLREGLNVGYKWICLRIAGYDGAIRYYLTD